MLTKAVVVLIPKYINVSNQHVIYLQLTYTQKDNIMFT